jgi:hypothetical protein
MSSDKTKEYRNNKKINKANIRSGQKKKNSLIYPEEEFNVNELPSGAFDKINNTEKENIENKYIDKTELKENKIEKIIVEQDEEYEEFDENYFEPTPYVKK